MTGTFGSLNIAKSGLQYQQIVMDTASSNISNVSTDGYVRRAVSGGEVSTGAVSAVWSTSDDHGTGVTAVSVSRLTDQLADTRVRREHATLSSLLTQQSALSNVETAINEPSDSGVSAALSDFSTSLQDLANSPDSSAARATVLADAKTLTAALHSQAQSVADQQDDLAQSASDDVAQVNQDAQQLASLNKSIAEGQASGSDVNALLDQRDQVALELANLSGGVATVGSDGRMTVTVGGSTLVDGDTAYQLGVDATDATKYQITDPSDDSVRASGLTIASGELGGIGAASAVLTTYSAGLDTVAANLAAAINGVQQTGYDLNGTQDNAAFFGSDPADATSITAANITVLLTAGSQIAASATSSTSGNYDGTNATMMVDALGSSQVEDSYEDLVSGLGAQISGLNSQVTTQQAIADQADSTREQSTGVSIDEETINLTVAQRAYEASSRVLTVLDSVLDTLINHTGVTA